MVGHQDEQNLQRREQHGGSKLLLQGYQSAFHENQFRKHSLHYTQCVLHTSHISQSDSPTKCSTFSLSLCFDLWFLTCSTRLSSHAIACSKVLFLSNICAWGQNPRCHLMVLNHEVQSLMSTFNLRGVSFMKWAFVRCSPLIEVHAFQCCPVKSSLSFKGAICSCISQFHQSTFFLCETGPCQCLLVQMQHVQKGHMQFLPLTWQSVLLSFCGSQSSL